MIFLELNAKHIHALKLSDILIVIVLFGGACICLAFNSKKNALAVQGMPIEDIPLFAEISPCLRCASVLDMFLGTDLKRI